MFKEGANCVALGLGCPSLHALILSSHAQSRSKQDEGTYEETHYGDVSL